MSKFTFAAAILIAVAASATQASAATSHAASRQAAADRVAGCMRAPDVGAFATAPYRVPPCLPGSAASDSWVGDYSSAQ